MNYDKLDQIQEILNEIDYQKFNIENYSHYLLKDLGNNNLGQGRASDEATLIINSYFRKEIEKRELIKKMNEAYEKYGFKFHWEGFPEDLQDLKIEKIYSSLPFQVAKRPRPYEKKNLSLSSREFLRENKNLLMITQKINELTGSNIDLSSMCMMIFIRWKHEPNFFPPRAIDFVKCLLTYLKIDQIDIDLEKVRDFLEVTKEDYKELNLNEFKNQYMFKTKRKAS